MPNLTNSSGLRAAFIDHLDSIYYEGYAETLNSADFDFLFNEYKNA